MTPLQEYTLAIARRDCVDDRVLEIGRNDGPVINKWQRFVNCRAGDPYCAAAVSFWICQGHGGLAVIPRFKRSASALGLLTKNHDLHVGLFDAKALLQNGVPLVFVQDHGSGKGHCGIAFQIDGIRIHTYEANTGPGPNVPAIDRDGQGCYERHDRLFSSINGGFLAIA